ncbi:AraC family transcriptional regulator [Grimontia hollisae]|uniref:Transcriptional regulator AraC family n=1 Tax=Grimontia hollisae CIP 101886 TaxID=675812 RepID=D0I6K0_GRIHO|nr:helix-turn-helix transcriptional regulator [Grimontia hollisae]AMG31542.1 AraC family transcriptional regulator [Grimontia hollisae]EEY72269.1 transcriptional regulator AraC family [Grimontia hollisae CIP 101886]STO45389.1 HTH-type transcriptional regulator AdiY [Grimontia hollisae]
MTRALVRTGQFRGIAKQPLRNVSVYAPTIIWVRRGFKQLWWHDRSHQYSSQDWLVIPASHSLTFVNEPAQTDFCSHTLTFLEPPPREWLAESQPISVTEEPRLAVTPQLAYCFETLYDMAGKSLSEAAQRQFLLGFYAELQAANALHLLFPGAETSMKEKLARYLSANPGDTHHIKVVAAHFSMSPATLKRKLAAEDTSFRHILTHTRMTYALSLMQKSRSQLDVALACGYQSEARFSRRFKEVFGLSPKEYVRTL